MKTLTVTLFATLTLLTADFATAQQVTPTSPTADKPATQTDDGSARKKGRSKTGRRPRKPGPEMLDKMFERFDTDGNGSLSISEAPGRMQERFGKIDANGDQSVTKEELKTAFEKMRGDRSGQSRGAKGKGQRGSDSKGGPTGKGKTGKGQPGKAGGPGQRPTPDPAKLIQRMDSNNDGMVSLDEAPERMKSRFGKIDTDGNGSVTAEELKAAFEKRAAAGGKAKGRNKADAGKNKAPQAPKRPPVVEQGN